MYCVQLTRNLKYNLRNRRYEEPRHPSSFLIATSNAHWLSVNLENVPGPIWLDRVSHFLRIYKELERYHNYTNLSFCFFLLFLSDVSKSKQYIQYLSKVRRTKINVMFFNKKCWSVLYSSKLLPNEFLGIYYLLMLMITEFFGQIM